MKKTHDEPDADQGPLENVSAAREGYEPPMFWVLGPLSQLTRGGAGHNVDVFSGLSG